VALVTKKHLGQHWLHDPLVIARIAQSCAEGVATGDTVIEIGPGEGALTQALLQRGLRVVAVELDPRCVSHLQSLPAAATGQLQVVPADALQLDWPALLYTTGARHVVGNLPYNVGTEIVARLLLLPQPLLRMVFLLQKEVVLRLVAKPNTPDWGRLGVLTALLADAQRLFDVAPGAFSPPPKVMSSVVALQPLPQRRYDVDLAALDQVLRAGFGQRRKMLRGSLKPWLTEAQILAAGANPTARLETLDLATLCRLAKQLSPSS
jgi:16S rRNA (adenine1518-N6/adenine1519-N6)-dimethyltransferase